WCCDYPTLCIWLVAWDCNFYSYFSDFDCRYYILTKRAMVLSVLTVLMVSFFIYITEDKVESLGDPLVSAVFAGFFIGIGCGLIFRTGSSMGGTSLIAIMFNKLFGWDMVRAIFIMDVMIVLSGF